MRELAVCIGDVEPLSEADKEDTDEPDEDWVNDADCEAAEVPTDEDDVNAELEAVALIDMLELTDAD